MNKDKFIEFLDKEEERIIEYASKVKNYESIHFVYGQLHYCRALKKKINKKKFKF